MLALIKTMEEPVRGEGFPHTERYHSTSPFEILMLTLEINLQFYA